jgi:adenosine deaminase
MVEINLSSNEGILGVKGAEHPFPLYRAAHVPVALSTDDEGVSRIDLTHEYLRAALDYRLGYQDLKQLARTSLEHSFLAGASLWAATDSFTTPAAACQAQPSAATSPRPGASPSSTAAKRPPRSGSWNGLPGLRGESGKGAQGVWLCRSA